MTYDVAQKQESGEAPADIGLSFDEYQKYALAIQQQPNWRKDSDRCADYYDGNQIDPETADDLASKGLGPLITNIVRPTIDAVLGAEARSRTDWRVTADDDKWMDVAEAQSAKLKEAERETRADRACSDAYASLIKSGIGWVEVSRNLNPFKYPHRVQFIHRREIAWDWHSQEPDLADCKYLTRKRWFDIEEVVSFFPQHEMLIRGASSGWGAEYLNYSMQDVSLSYALNQESRFSVYDSEWREPYKSRVCLTEMEYRTYTRGYVLRSPKGDVIEMNPRNMAHMAAISRGMVKPEIAVYSKICKSIWLGPHKLSDSMQEARAGDRFTYIPFWGYREDLTGVPYGLIRNMLSPQDEVNTRRRKLLMLLSAKRLITDSDALDKSYNTLEEVLAELSRPDASIVLDPNRRNIDGFKVNDNIGMANQQWEILQAAKNEIQESAGVYNSMMGRTDQATSGYAINSLIEQGSTTLAEINDNAAFAKRLVGQALLDQITQDMMGTPVQVLAGEEGKRKVISLNKPVSHPQIPGLTTIENDLSKARTKVTLEDTPSTASYRQQQQVMMAEVLKSLPPNAQALLMPFYVENSDLKDRRRMAELLRKSMGQDQEQDPEKMQLAQQVQQLQAALQQLQQSPQMRESAAKAEKTQADALVARATADKIGAEIDLLHAKALESRANTVLAVEQAEALETQDNPQVEKEIEDRVYSNKYPGP